MIIFAFCLLDMQAAASHQNLRKLHDYLSRNKIGGKWYFPVLLDTNEYLDEYDMDVNDLFLAIVTELAQSLRDKGVEIKESYFTNRLNEVKKFFFSEVEIAQGEASLFSAKAKITGLKRDRNARQTIRQALDPQRSSHYNTWILIRNGQGCAK